jgi:hypothetical protein
MRDLLNVHWKAISFDRFKRLGRGHEHELSSRQADGPDGSDALLVYKEDGVPRLLVDCHTDPGSTETSFSYFENRKVH